MVNYTAKVLIPLSGEVLMLYFFSR